MPTPACYKGKVSLISRWEESSMLICNGYAHAHSHNSGTTLHPPVLCHDDVVTAGRWLHSLWLVSLCPVFPSLCASLPFVSVCLIAVRYFCCCFQISCTLYFWTLKASSSILHFGCSHPPHEQLFVTLLLQTAEICVVHKGVGHTVCCVVGVDHPCVHVHR